MNHSITFGYFFSTYNSALSYDPWDAVVQYKGNNNGRIKEEIY